MSDLKDQFESKMKEYIEIYANVQDFHAIETPLKSDAQFKCELKNRLEQQLSYESLIGAYEPALQIIKEYLDTLDENEKKETIENEISNSMNYYREFWKSFSQQTLSIEEWIKQTDIQAKTWTLFYGLKDETINFLYEIVLKKIEVHEISQAKSLLQLLLLYAPGISSYWNALGFCLQKEGHYEEALLNFKIAKEMNSENLETYFYLIRCYQTIGDYTAAIEQLDQLKIILIQSPELSKEWKTPITNLENALNKQGSYHVNTP